VAPGCGRCRHQQKGALIPRTTNVIASESLLPIKLLPSQSQQSHPDVWFFVQDHTFAGISVGTVVVLCMNSHDLLNVKFQVSTRGPEGNICHALCDIHVSEGWQAVCARMSRGMRAVGGSTYSCTSALSSLHCWTSFLRIAATISLSGARLMMRPLGFSIPCLFRRIEFTPFQHYTCFMPHSSVAYSA
jgi:hypothetical protein